MVNVPFLASPKFSATVRLTVPGPLLLLADVTETNDALELTLQAQPLLVVTLMVTLAPTPATFSAVLPRK
jgi:hypothetical protein